VALDWPACDRRIARDYFGLGLDCPIAANLHRLLGGGADDAADDRFQEHAGLAPPPCETRRLIQINPVVRVTRSTLASMARRDWTYALSFAATLALAVGAICVLLLAM
jgi:hypothetical protein